MKIVINGCYGGFSISLKAATYMAERGHAQAKAEIEDWTRRNGAVKKFLKEKKWPKDMNEGEIPFLEIAAKYRGAATFHGYGHQDGFDGGYKRDDPLLVEAVEALGSKAASGELAALRVVEIPDGTDWLLDEYDGVEHIAENHRTWR